MPKKTGFIGAVNSYLRRNRIGELLVSRGKLTPHQLKEALALQKSKNVPLGRVLTENGFISPFDLKLTLGIQSGLRIATAVLTIMGGLTTLSTSRQAHAGGGFRDIPNSIILASAGSAAGSVESGAVRRAPLFGTSERASTDLSSFTKWVSVFDRFARDVRLNSSSDVIDQWRTDLAAFRGEPLEEMADDVNDMMNRVPYIGDKRNWSRSDYWETPVEFLKYGGDCEDFAIAKYTSLRILGVPDHLMRIAIVKDTQKGIPHAILIVYTENGPMVLDNQIKRMTPAREISHYKPIFSINHSAWWLHSDRDTNPTQIASAAR